ncbi:alpha/beta hydrolase [Streptomyces sp. NBC_01498]|uniref:alpha/beta fold hydrolase n=1 Tax=Streptomyces sp. NBC_01498 TaxID=2975870 RepID=UPI002E7BDB1A|nr:alpha/beta hydrolase [Streptomyces sp. NBC_01498]WTL23129.1 alpha/beta hydrolase [Streptomyces sp. NBC_01498]
MSGTGSTYVLIPGAWHGGWSWRPVAERLRAAGHRAVCLTLPGLGDGDDPSGIGLVDAVEHVVSEVGRLAVTDVVLVAHSWGGYPAAGAAHRLSDRVAKVVLYAAQIPVRGRSLLDDNPPEAAAMLRGLIDASPTRAIPPSLQFVQGIFMPDAEEETQRVVAELLTPQPGNYFLDALDVPTVTELGIPALYILGEDDHALPRPGAEFAARLGLEPLMIPGTHEGLLTHPDELAEAILNH